jgi:hypothetical protein
LYLQGPELEDILLNTYVNPEIRWLAHDERSEFEESMRVPIRVSYLLKKSIYSHKKRLPTPMAAIQENMLFTRVDGFMGGYYG